jgi:FdhD protein
MFKRKEMVETHQISQFIRYSRGAMESRSTEIAIEAEVALSVNGVAWLSFRCSPENLEALAAGYLFNESFIQSTEEIASIHLCEQRDHIDIWLNHPVRKPDTWSKTSGCQGGVIQSGPGSILPVITSICYPITDILSRVDCFLTELGKPDYPQHGVHTTMLLDKNEVKMVSNDIGRHNTLDKIAGNYLFEQIDLSEPALITTGRISSEMVYKTARMAISLHSISHLAIKAADTLGITLIGHARRSQVDIYTHPERVNLTSRSE